MGGVGAQHLVNQEGHIGEVHHTIVVHIAVSPYGFIEVKHQRFLGVQVARHYRNHGLVALGIGFHQGGHFCVFTDFFHHKIACRNHVIVGDIDIGVSQIERSALKANRLDIGEIHQFKVVDIHRVGNTIGEAALARSGIGGNGEQDGFGFCAIGDIGSVVEGARHQSPIAHGHIGFVGSRHSHLVGVGFIFGVLIVGAIGDDCIECRIGIGCLGFGLRESHPEFHRVGFGIHRGGKRVAISIHVGA